MTTLNDENDLSRVTSVKEQYDLCYATTLKNEDNLGSLALLLNF